MVEPGVVLDHTPVGHSAVAVREQPGKLTVAVRAKLYMANLQVTIPSCGGGIPVADLASALYFTIMRVGSHRALTNR